MQNNILIFFTFSIIGWIIEILFCLIQNKIFINRGFMYGPYLPIYGISIMISNILFSKYDNILILFLILFAFFSIIEYSTSFILEKLFKQKLWDYSDLTFNINGRISLETMIPFSVFGSITIKYIIPMLIKFYNNISIINSFILLSLIPIFITDLFLSIKKTNKISFS